MDLQSRKRIQDAEAAMEAEEITRSPEALLMLNKHLFEAKKALIKRVEQLEKMLNEQTSLLRSIKNQMDEKDDVKRKKKRTIQQEESEEEEEDEDMETDFKKIQHQQAMEKREMRKVSANNPTNNNIISDRQVNTTPSSSERDIAEAGPSRLDGTTPRQNRTDGKQRIPTIVFF
ncbi:dnaJ homolog subfamily C member 21-like [Euwallacea fornicatus]|uniref:dnaJ homolog subfamily C member 21-like n=1 Tax=Euwallacea fornicatus TaxID=995702 RepID=UPI00338EF7B2